MLCNHMLALLQLGENLPVNQQKNFENRVHDMLLVKP